jgi:formylglycine-generating enzyme required for sulfatase activity
MLDEINRAGNKLNIVVLDACRDNPFGWSRSGSRGLQVVSNQPADSIIVYATSAGSIASDGQGRNGLFTSQLLKNLQNPSLEVNEVFRLTGGDVARVSGGSQRPAVYNQFYGVAYLGSRPSAPQPLVQPQPAAPPVRPVPANMVLVEGGTFQMGSTNGENDEKPVHTVTVKSFYLGRTEVTQKEWFEVMGITVAQQRDMVNKSWSLYGSEDNYPMYFVSWYDAVEYCNRRSLKEGLTPAYRGSGDNITCDFSASGYRLPTEAEWEYAAKGGNKDYMIFEYSGGNSVGTVAWYTDNSGNSTHPVGTKQANSLGLYDMSGNVWEWCWDWYGSYSGGSQSDPVGPSGPASSGASRVYRGGSCYNSAAYVRSAYRSSNTPSGRNSYLGFRLVRPQF